MSPLTDRDLLQTIVSYASIGNFDAAKATAARATDKETSCEAWRLLSRINANTQRFDEARSAIEIALQHRPESGVLRLERALVMEQQGFHAESLAELESLARSAADSPQLLVHLARALQFSGRNDEAQERLQAALHRWPTDVPLHVQLAQLLWRRGAGDAATVQIELAIGQFPREIGLRLVAADQMRNAGQLQKALGLLEAGLALAPQSAALLTSIGVLLDTMGRPEDALGHLRSALDCAPDSLPAKRNLVATLLRVGKAGEALRLCNEMYGKTPDDQLLLAYRATALRLLGDARYRELHDYPRLVRAYELRPPPRYADLPQFNSAFARELTNLHRAQQRPLAQSLRGGTQTERNLPADNPVVAEFLAMIDAPIKDYIAHLRDGDGHPVDRR
jgi:tetratricopeptide (TPR) repeat protein